MLVHDSIQIAIRFDSLEEECLTCGWLVSETIRKFEKMNVAGAKSNNSIIALQTVDSTITLDYWLSDTHRSISPLKDGTILKPFYSDSNFKIAKQKVNLNYFYILKLLGTGGTSKVFLGIPIILSIYSPLYTYMHMESLILSIARGKENGKFYAIKVISKKEALKRDKEEVFFNERNIMVRLNHPFLTKLYFSFQTVKYLPLTEIKNFQG